MATTVGAMSYRRFLELSAVAPAARVPYTVDRAGTGPVLFTAPHAVAHRPGGGQPGTKPHDMGTGQLAWALADEPEAQALVVRAPWPGNANDDPLERCPFKQVMVQMIEGGEVAVVVDLHGMRDDHGPDVCIGTGGTGRDRLAILVAEELDRVGLTWSLDTPFAGYGPGRVRTVARSAGVPAVQLEIARRARDLHAAPNLTGALYSALARIARRVGA